MYALFLCATVSNLYNVYNNNYNNNCSLDILLCLQPVSNNTCSLDLYSRNLQTTTVLFMQRIFTQDYWITTICCLLCLGLFFFFGITQKYIVFVFSLSRESYRDDVVVCVLCTHYCLCFHVLVSPILSHTVVVGLLVQKLAEFVCVVIGVAFVNNISMFFYPRLIRCSGFY